MSLRELLSNDIHWWIIVYNSHNISGSGYCNYSQVKTITSFYVTPCSIQQYLIPYSRNNSTLFHIQKISAQHKCMGKGKDGRNDRDVWILVLLVKQVPGSIPGCSSYIDCNHVSWTKFWIKLETSIYELNPDRVSANSAFSSTYSATSLNLKKRYIHFITCITIFIHSIPFWT